MYLKTERLIIRNFEEQDVESVFDYMSNAEVMEYIPEGVQTRDGVKTFIHENSGDNAKHFPVILKETNELIGHMVFHKYFGAHTFEIGWVFHPNFYNRGFASEAAHALLKYGFEELRLHRIIATCQPENIGSYRVMEKIGMRKEGFFKKCIPNGDGWWDEYYYAILEEDWKNMHPIHC